MEKTFLQKRWVRIILCFLASIILFNTIMILLSLFLFDINGSSEIIYLGIVNNIFLANILLQPVIIISSIVLSFVVNPKWKLEINTGLIPWYNGHHLFHPEEYRYHKKKGGENKIKWRENIIWYDKFEFVEIFSINKKVGVTTRSRKNDNIYLFFNEDANKFISNLKKGFVTGYFTFSQQGYYFGVRMLDDNERYKYKNT